MVTKGILTNGPSVTVSKKAILSYRLLKVKIKYSWSFTQHEILGMKGCYFIDFFHVSA